MINEDNEKCKSNINSDSMVKEINNIVETIFKSVFRIIDNSFDQLANRSSNTFGMRVKDSLILKIQQINEKEIPFNELKKSLIVCRLIVDDDLQIRFLPRIESLATSSDGENLSTRQKKSVTLADEVKIFNQVENEFFSHNQVGFLNELMDTQNDRIIEEDKTMENDDETYDFNSQKSYTSTIESENSMDLNKQNRKVENINDFSVKQCSSSPINSQIDSKDIEKISLAFETSECKKVGEKKERTFQKESKINATITSGSTNSYYLGETLSKVSLERNKLSEILLRTNNEEDQRSTNDHCSKQPSSKVSQEACQSSEELSRTDTNKAITREENKYEIKICEMRKQSDSSLGRIPANNILQSDFLGMEEETITPVDNKVSQRENEKEEIDRVEMKINCSRWSLLSRKSSTKLERDKQEIMEKNKLGNDGEDFAMEQMRRNKSMLNVISISSIGGNSISKFNLQTEESNLDFSTNLKDKNDVEKFAGSLILLDAKFGQSSAMIEKENLINAKEEVKSSVETFENDEGSSKNEKSIEKVYNSIEHVSQIAKQLVEETLANVTEVYSAIVESKENRSNVKSIRNDFELFQKSSKDSEPKLVYHGNENLSLEIPTKCLNEDELSYGENSINDFPKDSLRESKSIEIQETLETNSKSKTNKTTMQNSSPVFSEKSESIVIGFVVEPIVRDEVEEEEEEETNETSRDLMKRDQARYSLLSSIKSIFKSPRKSLEPRKPSVYEIEDTENPAEVLDESLHSFDSNKSDVTASGIAAGIKKEQSIHLMKENQEMPLIQSMKSLQDNRKRTKNEGRLGHKLFDNGNSSFETEDLVANSYQAVTQSGFIRKENDKKIEDTSGIDDEEKSSKESVAKLNSQILSTEEEKSKKILKKKQNFDGNAKKFAISLSRIFINSSRKKNGVKETQPKANYSQTNPEDHFEITKIPLSSSDDSSIQDYNDCKIVQQKSNATELDNREELVAVNSLNSTNDSVNKLSSKLLESNCTISKKVSNIRKLNNEEESGTVIFSAPIEAIETFSENELTLKNSMENIEETRKYSGKIHVAKSTIVSYAPMVESAKYLSNECDDRSNGDIEELENRNERSSGGKSFSTIRKLFSRASIRSRQSQVARDNDSIDRMNREENKKETLKREKSSMIKQRCRLNNEAKRESIISVNISLNKISEPIEILENPILEPTAKEIDSNNASHSEMEKELNQKSPGIKKGSFLSTAKSFIKKYKEIEKEEVNLETDEGIVKTESVFSRGLKKLFKKRSSLINSVTSNNDIEDPEDDSLESLNKQNLSHPSTYDSKDVIIEREIDEAGKSKKKEIQEFAFYTANNSGMKFPVNYKEKNNEILENSKLLDNLETNKSKSTMSLLKKITRKSMDALSTVGSNSEKDSSIKSKSTRTDSVIESPVAFAISETHISTSFPTEYNPESETRLIKDENILEDQSKSEITSKNFRLDPIFANKRSTIVMMATPDPPRSEIPTQDTNTSNNSREGSSNSPTFFYYLLGPSLDEALVDIRIVFQNLIDKIIGRSSR